MISIFFRKNSISSRCAISWFERYGIEHEVRQISTISKEELIHLLTLTEKGFQEVIKNSNKCHVNIHEYIEYIEKMFTFNEAVDFLLLHTELFRNPIILGEKNYLVGYNDVEIRRFFPKEYRFREYRYLKERETFN